MTNICQLLYWHLTRYIPCAILLTVKGIETDEDKEMTNKFELNGKWYMTDDETIKVLRSIIPSAKNSSDSTAVIAVMALGLKAGRIIELA